MSWAWRDGALLIAVLLAACGGEAAGGAPATTPATPTASASASGSASASEPNGAPVASASASPSASSSAAPAPSGAPFEMKPPIPTAMAQDLQALGLDPAKLPPLEKLTPKTLRGVMKLLAKSTGEKCSDCHDVNDFAAPTRRKKIATKMWDEFAAKLSFQDGSPLFCDSCHQGRTKQLDRSDKKALGKWMDASFVVPLKRNDGKDHGCETCHGAEWEMNLLAQWSK